MRSTTLIKNVSALLFLLLVGCATTNVPTQPTPQARIGLKLTPASFGQTLTLQQHLTVEHPGRTDQLDTVLQIDPQQLDVVGLMLGQRVMTLHYDGSTLQIWRHPRLPAQVQGADVLENIELTLWPADAIRQALPLGWRIEEKGLQRKLFFNGTLIMTIDYSNQQRWVGKVVLTNLRYHYLITIQSAVS